MLSYGALKILHVSSVMLSISGFLLRAYLMLRRSPLADQRWVQNVPHLIDTVLLASALGMVWVGGRQVFGESWLAAKIGFLLAYIVCGALALKRAPSERSRRVFLVVALILLANIVTIALTRNPWGLAAIFEATFRQ